MKFTLYGESAALSCGAGRAGSSLFEMGREEGVNFAAGITRARPPVVETC